MGIRQRVVVLAAGLLPGYWSDRLRCPVFVIGCSDSGKSLLSNLLDQHCDLAKSAEWNELWDPAGYPWHASDHQTPPDWLDPEAFTARWWREAQPRARHIRAALGLYQFLRGRPFFVNDTPLHTYRIPHLLEIFPDARFIHIVRDGRAVLGTYTPKQQHKIRLYPEPYRRFGVDSDDTFALARLLAIFWKRQLEEVAYQDQALELSRQRLLLYLTYEDLCADPLSVLEQVAAYLGVDPGGYAPSARRASFDNQNQRAMAAFSPAEREELSALMEPQLSRWGYGQIAWAGVPDSESLPT